MFDEAQQLKNPYTAMSKAAAALSGERRIALSATPVENRLNELWDLRHLLNPGLLGSLGQFRQRFALPIERNHDATVAEQLRDLTAPFLLRRLKSDRSIVLPTDLEEAIAEAGVALFPHRWSELEVRCGCPDDAVLCEHIAAVLYVFAQQLDADP